MEIVAMQQSYAKTSGVLESVPIVDLVEDAIRMNLGAMERHRINLLREYSEMPPMLVEKHKVLQVLVNLIRNAKYACDDSEKSDKQIILRVANGNGRIKISVIDNGIGIPAENMTRIFNHGFTTRKNGHGFGLHSGALAAKEMGGNLAAFSEGHGPWSHLHARTANATTKNKPMNINPNKNHRILVIDDNKAIHEDFRKILTRRKGSVERSNGSRGRLVRRGIPQIELPEFQIDSGFQGQEGLI